MKLRTYDIKCEDWKIAWVTWRNGQQNLVYLPLWKQSSNKKMGIPMDNEDSLWRLLNDSIESEVLNNTGIAKAAWWKMYSFLGSNPS